ncbi:MAG: hypothetical protein K2G37_00665 [Clostridia bacterium]|nr:hypothetical protein [Clostridia bacterium]MDE7329164.1 hypothetical protein [Clostridia bacterium]
MIRKLISSVIALTIVALLLLCVGYWLFNFMTLEKLGYADVEIGQTQLPDEEVISITPKTLGIENMTVKEIFKWFKEKIDG